MDETCAAAWPIMSRPEDPYDDGFCTGVLAVAEVWERHRFVLRAARDGQPVAIVNQGATRGDRYAAITVDAPLGTALPALVARVAG